MGKIIGLQINSLFALPPNKLELCGSHSATSAMENCALGNNDPEVAEEIKTFRTLWPYLQFIGEVLHCDPLGNKPAECYWLGDAGIYRFKPNQFELLLKYLSQQNEIAEDYLEGLRKHPPQVVIPFHTFQVLLSAKHGGGINETMLPGINNCMVSWGRIKTIDTDQQEAVVQLAQFTLSKNLLRLDFVPVTLKINWAITPDLKPGSLVAAHWGNIVWKISQPRANRLERATREVLKVQKKI